jgi:hypothetical protein
MVVKSLADDDDDDGDDDGNQVDYFWTDWMCWFVAVVVD